MGDKEKLRSHSYHAKTRYTCTVYASTSKYKYKLHYCTLVSHKIFKATPKIFGLTHMECTVMFNNTRTLLSLLSVILADLSGNCGFKNFMNLCGLRLVDLIHFVCFLFSKFLFVIVIMIDGTQKCYTYMSNMYNVNLSKDVHFTLLACM